MTWTTIKRLPLSFYTQVLFFGLFSLLTYRFVIVGRALPACFCLFASGFAAVQLVTLYRSTRTFVRTRSFVRR